MDTLTNHGQPLPAEIGKRALFTVEEFVQLPEFNYLSQSSLRHLIFNSRVRYAASGEAIGGNGLAEAGAIVRIGRKVMIDATKFREWINGQREIA